MSGVQTCIRGQIQINEFEPYCTLTMVDADIKKIQSFISSNPCEPQCQALALLLALYDDIEVMSSCDDFVHISVATAPHSHHSNLFFWSQPIRKQQQKQHTAYCWRVDCKANLCKATYFRETNMPPI